MIARILSVFAIFAIASAASLASTSCAPGETIEETKYTSPKGVTFTIKSATCKSTVTTRGISFEEGTILSKRTADECTDPEICLCGHSCNSINCVFSPAGTVRPADCTELADAILDTLHGSFFVNPGNFQAANSGTCEFVIVNSGEDELEYCWDDLAAVGYTASRRCAANQAQCHLSDSVILGVAFI